MSADAPKLPPCLRMFHVVAIYPSALVAPGRQVLLRNGQIIFTDLIDAPIEDVDCDEICLNPDDFRRVKELCEES
jgi:hypothetical protein